jgi:hypothetical protein
MHHQNNYYCRSKSRERRAGARHPFTASVEVMEVSSSTRIQARTSDVDRGGCFVDTMNSFAVGTVVMLSISRQNRSFKTRAKVVHSEVGMGMCLAFANTESSELWTLEQWLAELSGEETPHAAPVKQEHHVAAAKQPKRDAQTALKYLVLMLIQKNVLSDAEGSALLEKVIA